MASKPAETKWLSIPRAASMLGTGNSTVESLIAAGRLTVRQIPPSYRRVLRAEVERIAAESTIPAQAS